MTDQKPYYQAPYDADQTITSKSVRYGFFGSQGGVSQGLYNSLNCGMGSDDAPQDIAQNRAIAAASIGADVQKMASLYQIHSADVVTISDAEMISYHTQADNPKADNPKAGRPKADGLVTALPNIALSILTADCTPLLFYDEGSGVIGACHAGWRGAASGVIENTVSSMCALGALPATITCLIGPTIAKASYQVGADMRDEVIALAPHATPFFEADIASAGHYLFDLPAFAAACAGRADVQNIYDLARDTYSESDRFFSHRRATHQRLNDTGRQIAIIHRKPS